jgi:hypothetical protein
LWPRTRSPTRHPDGCRRFRKLDAVPARPPPATAAPLLAFPTGDEQRYQADAIGRAIRLGPGAGTPPLAAAIRLGPGAGTPPLAAAIRPVVVIRTPRRRDRVDGVVPECRRSCCAFRDRSTAATTMPTIVTCKTKPPSSAATAGTERRPR